MKSTNQAYNKTLQVINVLCQDVLALNEVSKRIDDVAALVSTFRNIVGKSLIEIDDSQKNINSIQVDGLLIISADDAFIIQMPDDIIQCPVGNAVKYNFNEQPNVVQIDNDGRSLDISIVPNDYLSESDKRLVVAIHFLIQSFNNNEDDEVTAKQFLELINRMFKFNAENDSEKEETIKNQQEKVNKPCFISSVLYEALSNIKIHKNNEQSFIKIIELIKSDLPKMGKMDFRDFTLAYSKTASYYSLVRKEMKEITFTYDSELDYIFMAKENDDNRYTKENYEESDEYRKLIIIESFLKAVAGKMNSKDFFNSIS